MFLFIEGKGYFCPLFLIVLFSFSVKLSNLYYIEDQHIFESIKLSNNKILMLSNNGHYIMDSNFSNLIYQESSYSFSCCFKYNKLFYFSEEYILFYNCDYLVFISKEGQILSENSLFHLQVLLLCHMDMIVVIYIFIMYMPEIITHYISTNILIIYHRKALQIIIIIKK